MLISRYVVTDAAVYDPDIIVLTLGADYDIAATPGFADGGFEYYTVAGAERLRDELAAFRGGRVMLAVLSIPFKCPPAPYEAILLLHDRLVARGIREGSNLHMVSPQPSPIPVSPQTSAALERAMAERGIAYTKRHRIHGIDPDAQVAQFKHHDEPYDLFIGIPTHKVPDVLVEAGLTHDGWVAVDPVTLQTLYAGVCAIGDCAETGIPKAGTFAESAAHVVADRIVPNIRGAGGLASGAPGSAIWSSATATSVASTSTSALTAGRPRRSWGRRRRTPLRRRSSARCDAPAGSGPDAPRTFGRRAFGCRGTGAASVEACPALVAPAPWAWCGGGRSASCC